MHTPHGLVSTRMCKTNPISGWRQRQSHMRARRGRDLQGWISGKKGRPATIKMDERAGDGRDESSLEREGERVELWTAWWPISGSSVPRTWSLPRFCVLACFARSTAEKTDKHGIQRYDGTTVRRSSVRPTCALTRVVIPAILALSTRQPQTRHQQRGRMQRARDRASPVFSCVLWACLLSSWRWW